MKSWTALNINEFILFDMFGEVYVPCVFNRTSREFIYLVFTRMPGESCRASRGVYVM